MHHICHSGKGFSIIRNLVTRCWIPDQIRDATHGSQPLYDCQAYMRVDEIVCVKDHSDEPKYRNDSSQTNANLYYLKMFL